MQVIQIFMHRELPQMLQSHGLQMVLAICTLANDQLNPMIVSNGNLGAIVVWQDYRSGNNFDIYMNGFNTSGIITAIEG